MKKKGKNVQKQVHIQRKIVQKSEREPWKKWLLICERVLLFTETIHITKILLTHTTKILLTSNTVKQKNPGNSQKYLRIIAGRVIAALKLVMVC